MKKNKKKINLFFFIIFFLIFSIKFDFFLNIYLILKNNAETRLVSSYGYCHPLGYGFIKEMDKKYKLSNYNINIKNKIIAPTSSIFHYSFKKEKSNYEILINFKDLNEIKNKFKLIKNKDECYLIEYKWSKF